MDDGKGYCAFPRSQGTSPAGRLYSMVDEMNRWDRLNWLIRFSTLNGLLASLIAFSNVPADVLFSRGWSGVFLPLALPAHLVSISLLLALLMSPFVILISNRKVAMVPAVITFWIFLVAVFIDARVFALFRFHLNAMVWNLITGGALREILSFSTTMWMLTGLVLGVILALEVLLSVWLHKWSGRGLLLRARYLLLLFCVLLAAAQSIYAWSDAAGHVPVTSQLTYIPWAQPLTVKRFLKKHGFKVADETKKTPELKYSGGLNYPREKLHCSREKPFNILMIVLDSLRFDMLSEEVMPNTWAFSRKSLNFTDHYSSGNCTRFGIFGLMYGLPGSYWHSMLSEQRGSAFVAELKSLGFDFHIHASTSLSNPEFDRTVFADISDRLSTPLEGASAHEKDTRTVNALMESFRKDTVREPFFGFLFLDAPHAFSHPEGMAPFQPESRSINYLELNNNFNAAPLLNLYKNAVYFDDTLVGKLLQELERKGYLDRTIVILTGDHGKEFNELKKNYWGHNSNFSIYQVKVPLVIYWPGKGFAQYGYRTSHTDVVPTLMQEALGCQNSPEAYSTGVNLFEGQEARILPVDSWSSRALVRQDRTIVLQSYGDMEVYDKAYLNLPQQESDSRIVLESLEMSGRFYRK